MALTINDDTAAVIETVLEALDIPHPATVGDEPAWLQCLSNRVMHVVIALRVMRENTAALLRWPIAGGWRLVR